MTRARLCTVFVCSLLATACTDSATSPRTDEEFETSFSHRPSRFGPGEEQGIVDLSRGFTYAIYPEGAGQNLVQTFRPSRNQKIGFVELPVGCAPGVLLNIRLREGIGGRILSDFRTLFPGPADGTFRLFQVADLTRGHGIKLRKNRTYAIELYAFPGVGATERTCGIAPGPAGDSYARGQAFFEDVPTNGPGFLPLPNGSPTDQEDLPFRTLVR